MYNIYLLKVSNVNRPNKSIRLNGSISEQYINMTLAIVNVADLIVSATLLAADFFTIILRLVS